MIIKDGKNYTIGQKTISILNENDIGKYLTLEEISQAEVSEFNRLIAETGFILFKGEIETFVIDINPSDIIEWQEKVFVEDVEDFEIAEE